MKKYLRGMVVVIVVVLGLVSLGGGAVQAAITSVPTISSASHTVNTSSTNSDIAISWTQATSGITASTITYDYLLDNTATHTQGSFTSAHSSASASRAGQVNSALSVAFAAVTDGTYYFHLRAYDAAGLVSGTEVLNFGPFLLDSKPAMGSSPVSPASGEHGKAVTLTITGSKFMSNATVKLVDGVRSGGSNPVAKLADVTLTNVSWNSVNQITAAVPEGTAPGVYGLLVSNGTPHSQSVSVAKVYTVSNALPVANAGLDQKGTLSSGSFSFALNGSGTDADGDILKDTAYTWTLSSTPTGVTATSSGWAKGTSKANASQSVVVNAAGEYAFTLVVNDGYDNSAIATTKVTVSSGSGNNKPVAKVGSDQLVAPGTAVTLTGSFTDADGNSAAKYAWVLSSVPSGSTFTASPLPTTGVEPTTSTAISQTNTAQASAFFTPDKAGVYTVVLYVKDNHATEPLWSDGTPLTVTANNKPTAKAGTDQTVGKGVLATLDGSGSSDPDAGEILTYIWSQASGPTVALSSASAQKPTFTPTELGSYVFSLVVKDPLGNSSAASNVTVTVANPPATPSAGDNQTVEFLKGAGGAVTTTVSLAGTNGDSSATTYAWAIASVPIGSTAASLTSLTGASGTASTAVGALKGTFKPDKSGNYVLSLTVSNSANVVSVASTVTIAVNARPVANAGSAQTKAKGSAVTLDGAASKDEEGTAMTYAWTSVTRPSGVVASEVTIVQASPSLPSATFTPPAAGDYTFALTVSDGVYSSTNTDNKVVITATDVKFSLDIDGNGKCDALTDGLLVLQYLAGFRGVTLTSGLVSQGATRTSEQINVYLESNKDFLDIDGNARGDALTDGLLVLQYLAGFRGATLTSGLTSATATRNTDAIVKLLESFTSCQ